MRWKSIIWFTVTVVTAIPLQNNLEGDFSVTNSIQDELNIDLINQALPAGTNTTLANEQTVPITTEENLLTTAATTTATKNTSDATFPTNDTTVATNYTTFSATENSTQKTTSITSSYELTQENTTPTTEGVLLVPTPGQPESCSQTTIHPETAIRPEQIGGSSEMIEEPDGMDSVEVDYVALTTIGYVQGIPWRSNTDIIGYIDIPYGSFVKFQGPTPPNRWEGIHKVHEHNKRCPQMQEEDYVGDLDCLTLSIFAPSEAINASVLVHIHESNFSYGSGDPSIYGPEYIVSKGVILVLPNYRLGPLGFLCLRNEIAPGNAALKDLTLALKWIKENIAAFGGDPTNIVVSGEGTSGALAGYLALSPESNGYISKVITESGSVLSHWALNRDPENTAQVLIQRIREISTLINTIETADIETIIRAGRNMTFSPCIEQNDHSFLSKTPWEMLHNGIINITFMIGSASHAGSIEAAHINDPEIKQMNSNFGQFLPSDLRFTDQSSQTSVGNQVKTQYFGNSSISLEHMEEISLCFTDSRYLGPALRSARALLKAGAKVFFYEFGFVGELNRELESIKRPVNATARGDIVGYLFSQDGVIPSEGSIEKRMIYLMVDLWISFITEGTPTSGDLVWAQLNASEALEEQWLFIGEEVKMRRGVHVNRLPLWTAIYDDYFIENNLGHQNIPNMFFPLLISIIWFWKLTI